MHHLAVINQCYQLKKSFEYLGLKLIEILIGRLKLIRELGEKYNKNVPDNLLNQLKTAESIEQFFKEVPEPELPKGIPRLELFHGQNIPPNLRLINYRKKKWSDQVADRFSAAEKSIL